MLIKLVTKILSQISLSLSQQKFPAVFSAVQFSRIYNPGYAVWQFDYSVQFEYAYGDLWVLT